MKKILIILTLLETISSCSRKPQNGYELIEQMYNAYKSNWHETLCFPQEVFYCRNDSILAAEVWHESYLSPGKLIIKFNKTDSGTGILFTNDSCKVTGQTFKPSGFNNARW
jgi:glutathione peroxidase-family protein